MSALGQKRTSRNIRLMSAILPKADIELNRSRRSLCAKKRNQIIFDCRGTPGTAPSDIFLITA
jgi:hypothetical protein